MLTHMSGSGGAHLSECDPTHTPPGFAAPEQAVTDSVVARISKQEAVSRETAAHWFVELLKFMDTGSVMRRAGDARRLVPSDAVDAAWHAFILHTRPYTEFCEEHHGGYVHHQVAAVDARQDDPEPLFDYLLTRVLIATRHGDLDDDVWPLTAGCEARAQTTPALPVQRGSQ